MSRCLIEVNLGQVEAKPELRLGIELWDTSRDWRSLALARISSLIILMLLWERLRLIRNGVSRTGTSDIPVPAMFRMRTVLGSLRTLVMESVVS